MKAITKTGSSTRTADRLHLAQPAVSRQLAGIEEPHGTALFTRTRKRMIPTRAGKIILHAAEAVLEELRRVELEISKLVHGGAFVLRIGTTCVFSRKWLTCILERDERI